MTTPGANRTGAAAGIIERSHCLRYAKHDDDRIYQQQQLCCKKTKNDGQGQMKSICKLIKHRLEIIMAVSEIQVRVIKATNRTETRSKQKHIDRLVSLSLDKSEDIWSLFCFIRYRLQEPSWVVVLKALVLIHSLIRKGDTKLIYQCLIHDPSLLSSVNVVYNMSNDSGNGGNGKANYISQYKRYLEEKINSFRELGQDYAVAPMNPTYPLDTGTGLLTRARVLERKLNVLLDCKFYVDEIGPGVMLDYFRLISLDLLAAFNVLNTCIIGLLERFFRMNRSEALLTLNVYREFIRVNSRAVEFIRLMQRFEQMLGFTIPKLTKAPVGLVQALERHLLNQESHDYANAANSSSSKCALPTQSVLINGHPAHGDKPVKRTSVASSYSEDLEQLDSSKMSLWSASSSPSLEQRPPKTMTGFTQHGSGLETPRLATTAEEEESSSSLPSINGSSMSLRHQLKT